MNFGKLLKRTIELTAAVAAGAYVYNKVKEFENDIEVDNVGKAVVDDLKNSVKERIDDVVEVYKDVSNEFKESVDDFVHYEEIDKETEEFLNVEFPEEELKTEVIEISELDDSKFELNHFEENDKNTDVLTTEGELLNNNETLYDLDSAEDTSINEIEEDIMNINLNLDVDSGKEILDIKKDELSKENEINLSDRIEDEHVLDNDLSNVNNYNFADNIKDEHIIDNDLSNENNYNFADNIKDDSLEQEYLTNVDLTEVNQDEDNNIEFKVKNNNNAIDDNEKQYIESIGNFFPYVSNNLIDSVYAQKEAISVSYTSGMHVKLYHLLTFENLENLNSFIQILDKHNYECKILNDKFQVEVSNEMKVKEGALLTDIYVVANQAGLLSGEYESFSIEELD